MSKEVLLYGEYSHDFEYYRSDEECYDFTHVMSSNTSVNL